MRKKRRLENAEVAQRHETPTASLFDLGLAGQKHSSAQPAEQIRHSTGYESGTWGTKEGLQGALLNRQELGGWHRFGDRRR